MTNDELNRLLGGWKGYSLGTVGRVMPDNGAPDHEEIWIGRGRSRVDVRPFFEMLGVEGRRRLRAVAIDMNGAYEEEVRYQCPLAEIVYDLFHVVVKYGREVIDRVRVDQANQLRHDKSARNVMKVARWLLLRNHQNLKPPDQVRLAELLQVNRKLMTVYVLKDDLKHLWDYKYPAAARRFWNQWNSRAIRSRIEPAQEVRPNLKQRSTGSCRIAAGRCIRVYWKGSTTRSRSSSAWPTASATMITSS